MQSRMAASREELENRPASKLCANLEKVVIQCNALSVKKKRSFFADGLESVRSALELFSTELLALTKLVNGYEESRDPFNTPHRQHEKIRITSERIARLEAQLSQWKTEFERTQDLLRLKEDNLSEAITKQQLGETKTTGQEIRRDNKVYTAAFGRKTDLYLTKMKLENDLCCCGIKRCNKETLEKIRQVELDILANATELGKLEQEFQASETIVPGDSPAVAKLEAERQAVQHELATHLKTFPQKLIEAELELDEARKKYARKNIKLDIRKQLYNGATSPSLMLTFLRVYIRWMQFKQKLEALLHKTRQDSTPDKILLQRLEALEKTISAAQDENENYFNLIWCPDVNNKNLPALYDDYNSLAEEKDREDFLSVTTTSQAIDRILPLMAGGLFEKIKNGERLVLPLFFIPKLESLPADNSATAAAQEESTVRNSL